MIRLPPITTRPDPLFPFTTLFRSGGAAAQPLHHAAPCGVGEGVEQAVEGDALVKHVPKYPGRRMPSRRKLGRCFIVYEVNTCASARSAFGFGMIFPSIIRSEEHTSELQSLMRSSYAVFCLKN